MAKADVLALVDLLALGRADLELADRYYREIVEELGEMPLHIDIALLEPAPGDQTFELPTDARRLLAAIYDDQHLGMASTTDVALRYGPGWRDRRGRPTSVVQEAESDGTYRLVPRPDETSSGLSYPHGSPLGVDYPMSALALFHTALRDDVHLLLELPVAFDICAREFARESDHRDPDFAATCKLVADLLYHFVPGYGEAA